MDALDTPFAVDTHQESEFTGLGEEACQLRAGRLLVAKAGRAKVMELLPWP